jgi:hypothetical protein
MAVHVRVNNPGALFGKFVYMACKGDIPTWNYDCKKHGFRSTHFAEDVLFNPHYPTTDIIVFGLSKPTDNYELYHNKLIEALRNYFDDFELTIDITNEGEDIFDIH